MRSEWYVISRGGPAVVGVPLRHHFMLTVIGECMCTYMHGWLYKTSSQLREGLEDETIAENSSPIMQLLNHGMDWGWGCTHIIVAMASSYRLVHLNLYSSSKSATGTFSTKHQCHLDSSPLGTSA